MAAALDAEIDEPSFDSQTRHMHDEPVDDFDSFPFLDLSSEEVTSMFESLTDIEEQHFSLDVQLDRL